MIEEAKEGEGRLGKRKGVWRRGRRGADQLHFPLLVSTNVLSLSIFLLSSLLSLESWNQSTLSNLILKPCKWHDGSGLTISYCFLVTRLVSNPRQKDSLSSLVQTWLQWDQVNDLKPTTFLYGLISFGYTVYRIPRHVWK